MPHRYALTSLVAIALLVLSTPASGTDLYAIDNYADLIYSFEDTVGSVANPDTYLLWDAHDAALDHDGRLLMAVENGSIGGVHRYDFDAGTLESVYTTSPGYDVMAVEPDLGDDIYVLMYEQGMKGEGGRDYNDHLRVLWDGVAPGDTAFVITDGNPVDMAVRRTGPRAGNIVVLMFQYESYYVIEIERTDTDDFVYYDLLADSGMMPSDASAVAIKPDGTVVVLGYNSGFHEIYEEYGYVWGFGGAYGPGLDDLEIDSDGMIFVANTNYDWIERYDPDGYPHRDEFGFEVLELGAIAVQGTVPTPEGEDVLVEPLEGVEITYEEVTGEGSTSAEATDTASRTSPGGNYLPSYAQLPGTRATEFTYISLSTDAIHEGLIQVDVLEEGSRLFYVDGVGDTFRCFTVVGSIDDARGTIPRFTELVGPGKDGRPGTDPTEVVLVEDDRTLPEVTKYKFWRLNLAMEVPDNMPGGDPCPWEFIEWLQKYPKSARSYYDASQYTMALSELAVMNQLIRDNAGTCIPDSSDDPLGNMVAQLLAHSKTLMFSIANEGGSLSGVDTPTSVSLSAASPVRGECVLSLSGPVGTEVVASVYDIAGRLVATVFEGALAEGGTRVVWNGLDRTGRHVASGVYFARVESENEVLTSKVVFLK